MKTLEITMNVKANDVKTAEKIAMNELMTLAKIVGQTSGSSMACGSGNATYVDDDMFRIDANVQVDGIGDINEVVKEVQQAWLNSSDIVNSMIFVVTETNVEEDEDEHYIVCDNCDMELYADDIVKNPIPGGPDLCPNCGCTLFDTYWH